MNKKIRNDEELNDFIKDFTEIGKDNELKKKWKMEIDKNYASRAMRKKYLAGSLIILLLLTLSWYFLQKDKLADNVSDNLIAVKTELLQDVNFRNSLETNTTELGQFRNAIHKNQFKEALTHLTMDGDSMNDLDKMLLAIAYIKEKDFDKSKIILLELNKINGIYQAESQWIMANMFLAEKNIEKAENILSRIVKKQEYKSNEALILLKRLKK